LQTILFEGVASEAEGFAEVKTSAQPGATSTGSIDISISAVGHFRKYHSSQLITS